jgi:hypothetical protein
MKRFGGATLCYRMLEDALSCFTQLQFQNQRFDKFSECSRPGGPVVLFQSNRRLSSPQGHVGSPRLHCLAARQLDRIRRRSTGLSSSGNCNRPRLRAPPYWSISFGYCASDGRVGCI